MAAAKIGLDFGTHYTKVCVEDSTDKRNRRYMFQKFYDLEGKASFVLPSVVQLNKDYTLSYGFVDTDNALMVEELPEKDAPQKPNEPVYRSYKQFPEPTKPVAPSYPKAKKSAITDFSALRDAIREKERQEVAERWAKEDQEKYEKAKAEYEKKCKQREEAIAKNKEEVDAYNRNLREVYERGLERWLQYQQRKPNLIPATFRSFKQMVFSNGFDWRFDIDPMLVSIWYLCYVFFDLDKEYGTQYLTVCMGTSSGRSNWQKNKEKATQIILTVYDLIENVFNHDREKFLAATFDELKSVTKIKEYSQAAKEANEIFVFPEAYANLNPLAKQKKFGVGVNAVVDIGGGTTDISIFVAHPEEDVVKIFDYESIPYGVNAIEKEGNDVHFHAVDSRMDRFSMKIKRHAQSIGVKMDEANRIVSKRPIVFTGGGSMRTGLCRHYGGFTDIIHIGTAVLNSYSIDEALEVSGKMPLLTTSLGLVLCGSDANIPLISYEKLFEIVEEAYRGVKDETEHAADYGLADT
jgi:uncharacterized phage-like protein YoqJ